jgi:hypothetical protein
MFVKTHWCLTACSSNLTGAQRSQMTTVVLGKGKRAVHIWTTNRLDVMCCDERRMCRRIKVCQAYGVEKRGAKSVFLQTSPPDLRPSSRIALQRLQRKQKNQMYMHRIEAESIVHSCAPYKIIPSMNTRHRFQITLK